MVFTSTVFLFMFLPIALAAFYICPPRWRAWPILITSSLFYGWGEPVLVALILASSLVNFLVGRWLAAVPAPKQRPVLALGITLNLLPLLVFKYLHFLLHNLGLSELAGDVRLPLPIGVSFYTFMAISYLIDIKRGRNTGAPSLLMFAAYLTMFPHLVAGPVVRWGQVGPQLLAPRFSPGMFGYGALRISVGLAKKSVLADSLSPMVDTMFATGAPTSTGAAWIAALLYSLQIYLDFSAYSDIAIGLAAMMGVRFEENFRHPYQSRSAREFWQRWHISLGSWFRDYVYIPLGGSRVTGAKLWRNLMIVWALTGFWHGAAWTFVVWGLYYGVLIGLERGALGRVVDRLPSVLQHVYGVLVAVLGWVIFRAVDMTQVGQYYAAMAGAGGQALWDARADYALRETGIAAAVAVLISAGAAAPMMAWFERVLTPAGEGSGLDATGARDRGAVGVDSEMTSAQSESPAQAAQVALLDSRTVDRAAPVLAAGLTLLLLVLALSFIIAVNYSPFIYFRF